MSSLDESDRERARRFYIRRAQTRKAAAATIGMAFDRMEIDALWAVVFQRLDQLVMELGDGTSRDQLLAARVARGAASELMLRGDQLRLQI
jgi:hypothetical protein